MLLSNADFTNEKYLPRKVKFLTLKDRHPLITYNPISLTLGGLMYFYQSTISPQLSSNCAYKISCSNFSKQSLQKFGLAKGVALSADRLMRCSIFSAIDIDPLDIDHSINKVNDVPEKYVLK